MTPSGDPLERELSAFSNQLIELAAALAQGLFARCVAIGGGLTRMETKGSSDGRSLGLGGDGRSAVLCS